MQFFRNYAYVDSNYGDKFVVPGLPAEGPRSGSTALEVLDDILAAQTWASVLCATKNQEPAGLPLTKSPLPVLSQGQSHHTVNYLSGICLSYGDYFQGSKHESKQRHFLLVNGENILFQILGSQQVSDRLVFWIFISTQ